MNHQKRNLYFYQGNKLTALKQGTQTRTILRSADVPLAELHVDATPGSSLLATDNNGSVLKAADEENDESHTYSAYGHDPPQPCAKTLLGFNGEYYDPMSKGISLGNGYRFYSPALSRFYSPDSWSPFGRGGVNAYAYCAGDPVNYKDPTGHIRVHLPNGQIMRVSKNQAVAAGHWLEPASLKRTTSLESGLHPDAPRLSRPQSRADPAPSWQAPRDINIPGPTGEKITDRVLEVVRNAGVRNDRIHIQSSQLKEFRYNQHALKNYKKESRKYTPENVPNELRSAIKSLERAITLEIKFGEYLWSHAPGNALNVIRGTS
ncbi:RHS repeat-associated core domain-containing protein [Pseudomonas plecoglossicida]|uniref:RHS repeat-associated core domain-containing protein n=1 Tax=Pseudomonas plecoglossicida TaxID=70775 RepID=UPI0015E27F72|nr:RHS repeat-associated core domain-containing protein [Pseudomonas plecoglossicida]MBA1199145.1 RHS repeat-associated core domain-containing protein [Pseudomonas plecoglossicida]